MSMGVGGNLDELMHAIDVLDIAPLPEDLADAFRAMDRLTMRIAAAVSHYDRHGLWAIDGASSMPGWLKAHAGRSGRDAVGFTRLSRRLFELPVMATALHDGSLSYGQVEAIIANLNDKTVALFAEHEAALLPTFSELTVSDTAKAMQRWASRAEDELAPADPDDEPKPEASTCHHSTLLDGTSQLNASLGCTDTKVVTKAIELALTQPVEGDIRPLSQRRADALVDICRFFLDQRVRPLGHKNMPHIDLVGSAADLHAPSGLTSRDGWPYGRRATAEFTCNATIAHLVVDPNGHVLHYGRTRRLISAAQFRAVAAIDRTCRFHGCDRPASWCDAHHVRHWTRGGVTDINNLVLLCNRHHHIVHQDNWVVELQPDRTLVVVTPNGHEYTTRPPMRKPGVA
jgi:Domain of unknown function (DUF222)